MLLFFAMDYSPEPEQGAVDSMCEEVVAVPVEKPAGYSTKPKTGKARIASAPADSALEENVWEVEEEDAQETVKKAAQEAAKEAAQKALEELSEKLR